MKLNAKRFYDYEGGTPLFNDLGLLKRGCWLAGGALRSCINNEPISDYDLFFRDTLIAAQTRVALEQAGYDVIFKCPEGKLTTYKKENIKIQCITEFYYADCNHLISTFDINACCYALEGDIIYTTYSAVKDTLKKRITFNKIDFPAATLKRVAKYSNKGYNLTSAAAQDFVNTVFQKGINHEPLDTRIYID